MHEIGCPWDKTACEMAAGCGKLATLQYLHENGCSWDKTTFEAASKYGKLRILQYLLENGGPRDKTIFEMINQITQPMIFKYLRDNGFPWDKIAGKQAIILERLDELQNDHLYVGGNDREISRYIQVLEEEKITTFHRVWSTIMKTILNYLSS